MEVGHENVNNPQRARMRFFGRTRETEICCFSRNVSKDARKVLHEIEIMAEGFISLIRRVCDSLPILCVVVDIVEMWFAKKYTSFDTGILLIHVLMCIKLQATGNLGDVGSYGA